jgi:hypothetical protein
MKRGEWMRAAILWLSILAAAAGLLYLAPPAAAGPPAPASSLCGNGVVDPGEQCDFCDPNVPVEETDRYNLCNCDCTLRARAMPLTLKMGAFYLVCGLALYGMRGYLKRLRTPGAATALVRMAVGLALGVALVVWGCLEWAGAVKPPMQDSRGVLFSAERQGGTCANCPRRAGR